MKVSVLILTFNEERNIERCIASLQGFDDIIVLDSGSNDRTCELAEHMGASILVRSFDNFANQRNFGLDTHDFKNEWVLHLDADEELTPEFRDALASLDPREDIDGWRIPSKTILDGRWLKHAGMYPTYQVRLGHVDRLRFQQVGHGQREKCSPDRVATFEDPYLHHNFSHGISQWFIKHVQYAADEARQLAVERGGKIKLSGLFVSSTTERRRALKALVNQLPTWSRPPLRFFQIFILRLGFLDGVAGLQYALMLSAYEAMIASFSLSKSADPSCKDATPDTLERERS